MKRKIQTTLSALALFAALALPASAARGVRPDLTNCAKSYAQLLCTLCKSGKI